MPSIKKEAFLKALIIGRRRQMGRCQISLLTSRVLVGAYRRTVSEMNSLLLELLTSVFK